MAQAAKRAAAIKKVRRGARLQRISRGLWSTGSLPQGTYGHQHYGVPAYEMVRLRRQAGRAAAGAGPGRCLTTTLAI
eukprot:8769946-Pyramimonas_sp.AAC.1